MCPKHIFDNEVGLGLLVSMLVVLSLKKKHYDIQYITRKDF